MHTEKLEASLELQKTNVSTTITLKHWRNNDTANKHANGKQTVSQTARKRYPNNIVNKDNTVNIEKGDYVIFPKGLQCVWEVHKSIKKHYMFK